MRGCDYSVHVKFEIDAPLNGARGKRPRAGSRYFIVDFNADGDALRIKERKTRTMFGVDNVYDFSWWSASSHPLGSGNTLPKRVIEAAHKKTAAEDRSANAVP